MKAITFSESEIQRLFGHEAAENEDLERLREYYFKSTTYEQVITDLPLRILVGHKGIGKSALFQVAMAEDKEQGRLAVLIKPDDIVGLGAAAGDFLKSIRDWKDGLLDIVAEKAFASLGLETENAGIRLRGFRGPVVEYIRKTLPNIGLTSIGPETRPRIERYLSDGRIYVYIDDLDRGWQGRQEDVRRISALMNAVRDIVATNIGIRFRINLRSDVYYLVRTSDESTDKIEGSVIWQSWTNHEIFVLLVKRIETFFGRVVNEDSLLKRAPYALAVYLAPVMVDRFGGSGHWENAPMYRVLMSLIRKRPRDLVKLCTLAARNAREKRKDLIRTENFENVFQEYSQGRIQDTINEFRSELPDIEKLLLNMKPNKRERTARLGYVYTTASLLTKIANVVELGEFRFSNGRVASSKDLAAFMYKINFLTARKETADGIVRKYFEENRYISSEFADFGFDWEIHPAYRWALQPGDISSIYRSLRLSVES